MRSGSMSRYPNEAEKSVGGQKTSGRRRRFTVALTAEDWPADAVGGKAQGLRRLAQAGFLIPPAFCVTTDAFEDFTRPVISEVEDLASLRAAIVGLTFSEPFVEEITRQLAYIGGTSFAVRSSAIEEDQHKQSFAGQQLSVLDVESVDGVLRAICEVWASLFGDEALLYRAKMGL